MGGVEGHAIWLWNSVPSTPRGIRGQRGVGNLLRETASEKPDEPEWVLAGSGHGPTRSYLRKKEK